MRRPDLTALKLPVGHPPVRERGRLAPNANLRKLLVPQGPVAAEQDADAEVPSECEAETAQDQGRPNRISWARLLKRVVATI